MAATYQIYGIVFFLNIKFLLIEDEHFLFENIRTQRLIIADTIEQKMKD